MTDGTPRFVSAHPDTAWFVWQTHVYLQNFIDLGIEAECISPLFAIQPGAEPTPELENLRARFPTVDFHVLADKRDERGRRYEPSIQPHLIEQWLRSNPARTDDLIFFHDSDIALRWLPDVDALRREHPGVCLLSDADSYIGFDYLQGVCEKIRKERPDIAEGHLIDRMCAVVGVDQALVRGHRGAAGGAQYVLSGIGPDYWAKVYEDSLSLRELFDEYANQLELQHEASHYLQVWTAGMWAYLWNLWAFGYETVVLPELAHLFGAHDLDESSPVLHMAGKTMPHQSGRFDKVDWHGLDPIKAARVQPYVFDHHDPGSVAEAYGGAIRAAAGVAEPGLCPMAPARHWRVLSWCADQKDLWDVEHLHFTFDGGVEVVARTSSGSAGPGYEAAHAFADDDRFWGGRSLRRKDCRPEMFLGVELDQPASPTIISLDQSVTSHRSRMVLLQRSDDGAEWCSVRAVPLAADGCTEIVVYRPLEPVTVEALRLVANGTISGVAWDVLGLDVLRDSSEVDVQLRGSGSAGPRFRVKQLREGGGFWGGRPDADGRLHLTLRGKPDLSVDRIVLEQGDEHWTHAVTLERRNDSGGWEALRTFDELGPGRNELLLCGEPPRWSLPKPLAATGTSGPPAGRPKLDPFADRRILVTIAAYRDADVENTVANAIAQAAYPEHLRFSICHQFDADTEHVLDEWADDPRFFIDRVPYEESDGCCWARHRTYGQFDDEPYLLQIDAHSRFAARWDVRFIEMLESTEADLPLLTTYPPGFSRSADGVDTYRLDVGVQSLYIDKLHDDLTTRQKTEVVTDLSAPGPSPTLAAGLIFTRGRFCRDVPYDPQLYFAGEEITLAARAFTSGYDLFHPNENLIWHRYGHDEPKHWEDHDSHSERHRQATERLAMLFRGDHRSLGPFGLGSARSLASFERQAGIRLRSGRGTDDTLIVDIDQSVVASRDDYDAYVVVLLDRHGSEIARREIRDPAVLDRSRNTVTLHGLADELDNAVDYVIVPTQRDGSIGTVVQRPI